MRKLNRAVIWTQEMGIFRVRMVGIVSVVGVVELMIASGGWWAGLEKKGLATCQGNIEQLTGGTIINS